MQREKIQQKFWSGFGSFLGPALARDLPDKPMGPTRAVLCSLSPALHFPLHAPPTILHKYLLSSSSGAALSLHAKHGLLVDVAG